MRSNIKLGRINGIEIGLHYSWFIIAALIVFSLGEHFHQVYRNWGTRQVWFTALFTAVLFFVSLLLHELSHSLAAQARGLKVKEITLFALGGVSPRSLDLFGLRRRAEIKFRLLTATGGLVLPATQHRPE